MNYRIAKFTTNDLVVIGLIMGLALVLQVIPMMLATSLCIPGIGGLTAALTNSILLILAIFIVRKFGTATILGIAYVVLLFFSPVFFVPGVYKFIILVPPLFLIDLIFLTLHKREIIAVVLSGSCMVLITLIQIILLILLGMPEVGKMLQIINFLIIVGLFEGAVGGLVGYRLYKKIENKPFVKRLRQ